MSDRLNNDEGKKYKTRKENEKNKGRKNVFFMMSYDMTILKCAQRLTDASLIYRTEPKTKNQKKMKKKN